ncbi:MAG: zf-HC2 domain-containing protein, partial [Anaerolineaceae bacterium]
MSHRHECQKYLPGLSDYIDGDLSPELCAELERHMAGCERCRIVVNTTRKTIELYQTSSKQEKIPAEVRERLYKRLDLD